METKVKDILELATTIPVLDLAYPNIWPCITFHFYSENGSLFGAGTATEESAMCQVDIWSKVKTDAVKLAIKSVKQAIVSEKYFSYPTMDNDFETATKIYHTNINFQLIKESEV